MTLNGSGVRDIACVLHVSPTTVIQELKKLRHLKPVNQELLQQLKPEEVEVDVVRVEAVEEAEDNGIEESELDEMWSYVARRLTRCGVCLAIDRRSGRVRAYVFARRKNEVFL